MRGRLVPKTWKWNPRLYAPARYRKACAYEAFVPDGLAGFAFSMDSRLAAAVSEAEQAIHALDLSADPALAPLVRLLLRTESIASSKIEGLQVDTRQLARAATRAEFGGKVSPTAAEILGNIDAMELAVDEAVSCSRFGRDQIVAIHRRLMERASNAQVAGKIREDQNWIGGNDYNPCGADFVPPPPEFVEELLEALCSAVDDEGFSPLVQAALIHAQFETIHPFADGNGRAGRALIHVVLRRRGLATAYVPPISVVLAADRDQYIEGLTDFRTGRLEDWIEQFSTAAARSAMLAGEYLREVAALMDGWRERLEAGAAPRSDAAAWAIIDILPAHPVITAPAAEAATGRAKAAIHNAIDQLAECGVLESLTDARRNRSWEAVGLLDLLEAFEAGRPPWPQRRRTAT